MPYIEQRRIPGDAPIGGPTALSRTVAALYLLTVALLPWSWFPPFPWLHEHAQWSDAVFAIAFATWLADRWRNKSWPRIRPIHVAMLLYLTAASISLLVAAPDKLQGAWKLLGMAELCALTVLTSDLISNESYSRVFGRVIALSSLLVAAAGALGLVLFYLGKHTELIGIYGELTPSPRYARVQAGFYSPNMLVSYCIFTSTAIARFGNHMSARFRRITQVALAITALLTFSRGIIAYGLALALSRGRTRAQKVIGTICLVLAVGLMASLTIWSVSLEPTRPLSIKLESNKSLRRRDSFSSSLQTLIAHPLWGTGPGTASGVYQGLPSDAHCTPLNIAATLGLPALGAFLWLLASLWQNRPRCKWSEDGGQRSEIRGQKSTDHVIWGGILAMFVDGLAQDIEDFRHLWVIFGLADSQVREARGWRFDLIGLVLRIRNAPQAASS